MYTLGVVETLDHVDEDKTVANAKNLLAHYESIRYLSNRKFIFSKSVKDMFDKFSNIQIPQLDECDEAIMIRNAILETIDSLDDNDYQYILLNMYVNRSLSPERICSSINVGRTKLFKMKRQALLEFAAAYPLKDLLGYRNAYEV